MVKKELKISYTETKDSIHLHVPTKHKQLFTKKLSIEFPEDHKHIWKATELTMTQTDTTKQYTQWYECYTCGHLGNMMKEIIEYNYLKGLVKSKYVCCGEGCKYEQIVFSTNYTTVLNFENMNNKFEHTCIWVTE
jgi:hypothetical protein